MKKHPKMEFYRNYSVLQKIKWKFWKTLQEFKEIKKSSEIKKTENNELFLSLLKKPWNVDLQFSFFFSKIFRLFFIFIKRIRFQTKFSRYFREKQHTANFNSVSQKLQYFNYKYFSKNKKCFVKSKKQKKTFCAPL